MSDFDHYTPKISVRHKPESLDVFIASTGRTMNCVVSPEGTIEGFDLSDVDSTDFDSNFVTEGLIDLQVNGFAGIDFNQPTTTAKQIDFALAEMARTGVTTCLPTFITGADDDMIENLSNFDAAVSTSRLGPLMVAGYHIEGPFLSDQEGYSGAHNVVEMIGANIELVDAFLEVTSRPIKIMTVAPEVTGVIALIPELIEREICVSIGHTGADLSQIQQAVKAGATLSTHLGNGVPQTLHKTDNTIFWQLSQDDLTAFFIPDGIHIPQAALQTMMRAKGATRTIVTTDAVAAAGQWSKPGNYTLGKANITLSEDGTVRIPGSKYLAGSSITMDQIVHNLNIWFGFSIPQILELSILNPARVLGREPNSFATKQAANFVEWKQSSDGPQVAKTHIGKFTIE